MLSQSQARLLKKPALWLAEHSLRLLEVRDRKRALVLCSICGWARSQPKREDIAYVTEVLRDLIGYFEWCHPVYISLCKGVCKQWNLRETWQNNRTTVTAQNWYHVIMHWIYKTKHGLLHITVWMLSEAYAQYVNYILRCKIYIACIKRVGVVN